MILRSGRSRPGAEVDAVEDGLDLVGVELALVELDEKAAFACAAATIRPRATTWRCVGAGMAGQGDGRERPHHGARNGARKRC